MIHLIKIIFNVTITRFDLFVIPKKSELIYSSQLMNKYKGVPTIL